MYVCIYIYIYIYIHTYVFVRKNSNNPRGLPAAGGGRHAAAAHAGPVPGG